jgi:hypothetical protein
MNEPPLHLSFGVPKAKTFLPPGPLLSPGYLSAVKSASTGPGEFIQKRKGLCRRKSGNQTERDNKKKRHSQIPLSFENLSTARTRKDTAKIWGRRGNFPFSDYLPTETIYKIQCRRFCVDMIIGVYFYLWSCSAPVLENERRETEFFASSLTSCTRVRNGRIFYGRYFGGNATSRSVIICYNNITLRLQST